MSYQNRMITETNFITADQARANVNKYLAKQEPIWNHEALERIGKITERINALSLRGYTSYKTPMTQESPEVLKKIIEILRSYFYRVSSPYTSGHHIYIDISW